MTHEVMPRASPPSFRPAGRAAGNAAGAALAPQARAAPRSPLPGPSPARVGRVEFLSGGSDPGGRLPRAPPLHLRPAGPLEESARRGGPRLPAPYQPPSTPFMALFPPPRPPPRCRPCPQPRACRPAAAFIALDSIAGAGSLAASGRGPAGPRRTRLKLSFPAACSSPRPVRACTCLGAAPRPVPDEQSFLPYCLQAPRLMWRGPVYYRPFACVTCVNAWAEQSASHEPQPQARVGKLHALHCVVLRAPAPLLPAAARALCP
jgi:hypothetical protein